MLRTAAGFHEPSEPRRACRRWARMDEQTPACPECCRPTRQLLAVSPEASLDISLCFYQCDQGHVSSRREATGIPSSSRDAAHLQAAFVRWAVRRANFKVGRYA